MIEVIRKDELVRSISATIEVLRKSSDLSDDEKEWLEEAYTDVLDIIEGWCSPQRRLKIYSVEEKVLNDEEDNNLHVS